MKLIKVNYSELNARQKENYNYHKIASALAEYGYDCMRLNNDWQGADFIAVHNDGAKMMKIQLKGRFTLDKKYLKKDIYVAFIENDKIKIFFHDDAISLLSENIINSISWKDRGGYSWGQTPKHFESIISIL